MDRAENVCSDPEILAKEIEHLSKVLHYNNYPQWMINQRGKLEKQDPLIHPETGQKTCSIDQSIEGTTANIKSRPSSLSPGMN